MKTIMLFFTLCCSLHVLAVEKKHPQHTTLSESKPVNVVFSFVRGHKLGKGHSVQWSMISNAGIDHFILESTYEDPYDMYSNWNTVGIIINTNTNINKYTDQSVMPGNINYRVIAVLSGSGGVVVSEIYTALIR